jgi:DUF4097 and DUF4098 domain-containing protein YvlB
MKKSLFFLLLFVPAGLLFAQNRFEKEPYMTKSLSSENIKNIKVETSGGSISVSGVAASEARIEVYVYPNNPRDNNITKEQIEERLKELYDLEVEVANNKLTAVAKSKKQIRDWKRALNIAFKVYTPKDVSTDLATSGGSISLSHLAGNQDVATSGGSLHLDNLSGKIKGRTSGGSIHLNDSKDEIDLATSGGSIDAKNCSGNLRLSTSGGSLKLKDLKGDIDATTSGGSINGSRIEGELVTSTSGGSIDLSDLMCSVNASTSGGNIDVSISQLGKYVKLSNSGGNIDLQLPKSKGLDLNLSANKIKTGQLDNFSGKMEEDEVKGKLNGGGVEVDVRAGSGRINLELK